VSNWAATGGRSRDYVSFYGWVCGRRIEVLPAVRATLQVNSIERHAGMHARASEQAQHDGLVRG
jgi:hypothetical protein